MRFTEFLERTLAKKHCQENDTITPADEILPKDKLIDWISSNYDQIVTGYKECLFGFCELFTDEASDIITAIMNEEWNWPDVNFERMDNYDFKNDFIPKIEDITNLMLDDHGEIYRKSEKYGFQQQNGKHNYWWFTAQYLLAWAYSVNPEALEASVEVI